MSINKTNAKEIEMYGKAVKKVFLWFLTLPI